MVSSDPTAPGSPVRILIADDDPLLRQFLVDLIAREEGFEVVGTASNAEETLQGVTDRVPHVLLLDLAMPGRSGFHVLEELERRGLRVPVLVLSGFSELGYAARALEAGARGFLAKAEAKALLVEALRAVANGEGWISNELALRLAEDESAWIGGERGSAKAQKSLSDRERQIVELVTQGRSNRQIADELRITEATVKSHVSNAMGKLRVENRTQLALLCSDSVPTIPSPG